MMATGSDADCGGGLGEATGARPGPLLGSCGMGGRVSCGLSEPPACRSLRPCIRELFYVDWDIAVLL